MKTILITGASSGIGKATTKYFSENGWRVIATIRDKNKTRENFGFNENVEIFGGVDTTKIKTIKDVKNKIIKKFKYVDVVLNNAGFGIIGSIESCNDNEIRSIFEVNVFGYLNIIKEFLPIMRKRNSGTIINITSIGGRITFPFFGYYNATKHSIDSISEALWYELEDTNIKVKVIEPGFTNTSFATKGMKKGSIKIPFYDKKIDKLENKMKKGTNNKEGTSPELIAKLIFKAANDKSTKLRYHKGSLSGPLLFFNKYLPEKIFMNLLKRGF